VTEQEAEMLNLLKCFENEIEEKLKPLEETEEHAEIEYHEEIQKREDKFRKDLENAEYRFHSRSKPFHPQCIFLLPLSYSQFWHVFTFENNLLLSVSQIRFFPPKCQIASRNC